MKNAHLRKDWVQLRKELKDTFQCADSMGNMYMKLYLEQLYRNQLKHWNVGPKAFILAY